MIGSLTNAPSPAAARTITSPDRDADAEAIEDLRAREYGRLDAQDHVYLDYAGGGLYAESQLREHQALLRHGIFGNPHSNSPTSRLATGLADQARRAVLAFFSASPDEYTVIFTANASGALKLVGESYPFAVGRQFLLTADNHNSVNGIREFARAGEADVVYVPIAPRRTCVMTRTTCSKHSIVLRQAAPICSHFPAQSNYSGVHHPLDWSAGRTQGLGRAARRVGVLADE